MDRVKEDFVAATKRAAEAVPTGWSSTPPTAI